MLWEPLKGVVGVEGRSCEMGFLEDVVPLYAWYGVGTPDDWSVFASEGGDGTLVAVEHGAEKQGEEPAVISTVEGVDCDIDTPEEGGRGEVVVSANDSLVVELRGVDAVVDSYDDDNDFESEERTLVEVLTSLSVALVS